MNRINSLNFLLVSLCFFFILGTTQVLKGSQLTFAALDSTFNASINTTSLEELQSLLDQMQLQAQTARQKGITERNTVKFHQRAGQWDLCLVPAERAEAYFEESNDIRDAILEQITQVFCHRNSRRPDLANKVADKMVKNCRRIPEKDIPLMALRIRGYLYRDLGQMDSARMYQEQVVRIAQEQGATEDQTMAKFEIAIIYQLQGRQKLALQTALEVKEAIFELPGKQTHIEYLNLLGMIYMGFEQFDKSFDSYQIALKIAQENKMVKAEATGLNNIGLCLKAKGDSLEAINYFEQALEKAMPLNSLQLISSISSGLADSYINLKKWKQAGAYADKAYYYSKEMNDPRMISYAIICVATVKINTGEDESALDILHEGDSIARSMGNYHRVKNINNLMSKASENLGDLEGALKYQRFATVAQDSLDFLDARKYADSLKLSQPVFNITQKAAPSRNWPIWLFISLFSVGIAAFLYLRFRPKALTVVSQPEEIAEDETQNSSPNPIEVAQVIDALRENKDWTAFMLQFDSIYPGLMETMGQRHADITPTDLRILALSRLGLSADEFAEIMGVSTDSAKKARYRTRKRLGLESDQSLLQYMLKG